MPVLLRPRSLSLVALRASQLLEFALSVECVPRPELLGTRAVFQCFLCSPVPSAAPSTSPANRSFGREGTITFTTLLFGLRPHSFLLAAQCAADPEFFQRDRALLLLSKAAAVFLVQHFDQILWELRPTTGCSDIGKVWPTTAYHGEHIQGSLPTLFRSATQCSAGWPSQRGVSNWAVREWTVVQCFALWDWL